MLWLMNTIEDTTGRYSEAFRASLFQFHGYASRLSSELPVIGDEAEIQRLQYQIRMWRDLISEEAQKELAAALLSPCPLSLVLSHIHEHEATYFLATVKNETEEQINNWAVQLEVPPLLVNGTAQEGYLVEESDKRKAVFRAVETRPLWHGASSRFKVRYQLSEANHGLRAFNVRATAYVGGKLVAEQIKGIDELSTYFLPVVVARREAQLGLLMHATQLGDEVVKAQATAPASTATPPPDMHDDEAKVLLETWLSELAEKVHSLKARSSQIIAPADIVTQSGVPEAKVVSLLAIVARENEHFGVTVQQLQGGKFHLDVGAARVRQVRGRGFGGDGWET